MMNQIEKLLAIEEIKRLKAKYFYCLDHKDWDGWKRDVFAPDIVMEVPEALAGPLVGVDTILDWVRANAADQVSVHHGHMPDIEILSPEFARGVWAMEDRLMLKTPAPLGYTYLHGFGHYHETYVRLSVGWRLKSTRLTRLHVEMK